MMGQQGITRVVGIRNQVLCANVETSKIGADHIGITPLPTIQLNTDPSQPGTEANIPECNAIVNLERAGMPGANDVGARNANQNVNGPGLEECSSTSL